MFGRVLILLLDFIGEVATRNPKAWIYSWLVAGMALAIVIYSAFGWWIGSLIGAPITTQYLALAAYGYWFVGAIPQLNAACDQQIELLDSLASDKD